MGDTNQLLFAKSFANIVKGPILEIGSKDYGNTQNFRDLFSGEQYLGIDMQPGKGVDQVIDLTDNFESIDSALHGERFNTIICMSVLEHCRDPFKMARNIQSLMTDDGVLLVSVPFSWEIHGFPDDYWRFTPSGVRTLFQELDFEAHEGAAFAGKHGQKSTLDGDFFKLKFSLKSRHLLGGFTAFLVMSFKKLGLMKSIFGYRYVFPPVMISMVGKKRLPAQEKKWKEIGSATVLN